MNKYVFYLFKWKCFAFFLVLLVIIIMDLFYRYILVGKYFRGCFGSEGRVLDFCFYLISIMLGKLFYIFQLGFCNILLCSWIGMIRIVLFFFEYIMDLGRLDNNGVVLSRVDVLYFYLSRYQKFKVFWRKGS